MRGLNVRPLFARHARFAKTVTPLFCETTYGGRVETETASPARETLVPSKLLFLFFLTEPPYHTVMASVVFFLFLFFFSSFPFFFVLACHRSTHPHFRKYFVMLRLGIPREEVG